MVRVRSGPRWAWKVLGVLSAMFVFSYANAETLPPIGVQVGEMYPDFALPTLDGSVHRFSEYRGKKVLLLHFASW